MPRAPAVTITRLAHRRSPFLGGRDHVSHRLVRVGFPVRAAVGSIYVAAASVGVIALVISRVDRTSAYLFAGLVGALSITAGVVLARLPVYDGGASVRPLRLHSSADTADEAPPHRRITG